MNNTAKSDGGGIWNNGTLNVEGRIEIRDNHSPTKHDNIGAIIITSIREVLLWLMKNIL